MNELNDLNGTRWQGTNELWLDPHGNEVTTSPCTIVIDEGVVRYTWRYENKEHEGTLTPTSTGAEFSDTWHQPEPMTCNSVVGSWALLSVFGTYSGHGETWGWRTSLCLRPSDELVLQMTNVAPWGEEGRAVRMVCKRQSR